MSEEASNSQSMNFSGQVSGVNAAQNVGGSVNQTSSSGQGETAKQLTPAEVIELIAQIEGLFNNSDLSDEQKQKALKHLDTAKEEVQSAEPDKDFATKNLQRATQVLKQANDAVGAGQGLWDKLNPIAETLAPWLGVAAKALLLV